MPVVSVVVPAYNREQTIAATLDSLIAQTFTDWQAIVVDDGSRDTTAEVIAQYARDDQRISLHRQSNSGVGGARNTGIALARGRWCLFLDADDTLDVQGLERLTSAAAQRSSAQMVYGSCTRIFFTGAQVIDDPPPASDLFLGFTRGCILAIHMCMVRTDLVRAVGGFDETLVVGEDWDFWQRVTRTQPVVVRIEENVAFYRIRPTSASRSTEQILIDGMPIIDRGHAEDPRLKDWPGELHPSPSPAEAGPGRLLLLSWAAGLKIAQGGDARNLIDLVDDIHRGDLDGAEIARLMFLTIVSEQGHTPTSSRAFSPTVRHNLDDFFAALAKRLDDERLVPLARQRLDRLIIENAIDSPDRVGSIQRCRVRVGEPCQQFIIEPGVDRLVVELWRGEDRLNRVILPACGRFLPAGVAIDALADEHTTWGLLQHLFAETIRPDLELKEGPNGVTVSRRGRGLGSVSPKDAKSFEGIANAVGWQLFLQELWGLPEWTGEDFYGGRTGSADGPRTPDVTVSGGVLPVELAVPLPRVLTEQREVVIEVSLAGVPLFSMRTPTVNGVLEPARLRQAVILAGGIELANVAIREAVMSEAWPADMTLRERLAALASRRAASSAERGDRALALLAELVPFGGTVVAIGRRPGLRARGPASHTHTFPYESRDDFLRVAHATGTPVLETGNTIESDAEPDGIGVYLPWLFDNIRSALYVDPEADELAEQFDLMFSATEDPWDYSTPYELQKYEDTASLLPERVRFAYEIGCAEGVFTARLASHADHLDAVDISHVALDRAATRCADVPNVSFERLNIFRDRLPKKADLIVCSELLYYANDVSKLRETVRRLIDALAPSGVLVTTNSNCVVDDPQSPGFDWDAPFGAAGIQDALLADGRVTLTRERVAPMYRVQRYELSSRVQRLLHRGRSGTPASERVSEISDLPPEVRHHFLPHGGFVDTSGRTGATTRYLPVLMYHRVSPHSVAANHRYTVSPGLFDEHMAWLHEHGFIPITIDEWVASVIARRPVQGRRVMLTFDDGYEDFAEYALPALTKYGLTAEVFVVSGLAGGQNTWESADIPRYRLMDWDTLASLPHRTVRIGAHTVNHRPLSLLSITEIADELLRCRETLEDRLGRSVTSIAYPYGIADPAVHHLAGAAGYRYGYAASGWFVPDHDHILDLTLSLPRAEITGSTTLDLFSRKLDPNGGDLDS